MLANVCVGDLGYVASNGNVINLSTSTIVHCYGDEEMTIGELIEAIDDDLADLAGQSLEDDEVKSAYGAIITCADHINNGIGIGETCKGEVDKAGRVSGPGGEETELAVATPEVELYRPYPNPSNLMQTVRMAYSISVDQAEVNVGVYDIAGRFVKSLVRGSFGAGRYEMSWDGTDSMGNRAKSGVYFVRGSIAGQPFGSRILRLQ
jgi:hypothetical protein